MTDVLTTTNITQMAEKAGEAARHLKLLANEKRLLILCTLVAAGSLPVGALAERVGLSQSALSQHLARMRTDGLVATRREGQTIYYRIDDPATAQLLTVLHGIYCAS